MALERKTTVEWHGTVAVTAVQLKTNYIHGTVAVTAVQLKTNICTTSPVKRQPQFLHDRKYNINYTH